MWFGSLRRVLTVAVFALVLTTSGMAAAQEAGSPATLTGETFTGTISNLQWDCNSSHVSFDSDGIAVGPYVGTYTAHISVDSDPTPSTFITSFEEFGIIVTYEAEVRVVTTYTESFEIVANDGTVVTGTKSQVLPGALYCSDEALVTFVGISMTEHAIERISQQEALEYAATIHTPGGDYRDEGTSREQSVLFQIPAFNTFSEGFASSLATPIPPTAMDKDVCKDGSWQERSRSDGTRFKNQGDCVSYVNTGK
jgi:hypothetical protein